MSKLRRIVTASLFYKGGVIHQNERNIILLQRQGTSNTFYGAIANTAGNLVSIQRETDPKGESDSIALYFHKAGDRDSSQHCLFTNEKFHRLQEKDVFVENPISGAEAYITSLLGIQVAFNPQPMAYMFNGGKGGDIILSNLFYEASTDTIRTSIENYCVVAFQDGRFDERRRDIDAASQPFQAAIDEALRVGFHDCDRRQGDDYCKRRLAWLAGAYLNPRSATRQPIAIGLLRKDMEWPDSYEELRLTA